MESGVRVEDEAVILGPSFLGEGVCVGRGALVSQSIVAPGVVVGSGEIVRNQVTGRSFKGSVQVQPSPDGDVSPALGRAFRQWPPTSYARLGKRVLDIIGSLLGLCLTAIIFPIVAVAIKLNSRGPVFYLHRRQGRAHDDRDVVAVEVRAGTGHHRTGQVRAVALLGPIDHIGAAAGAEGQQNG